VVVSPALLVGAGRARQVARYMALVAAGNLALSVALTPELGLEGPAVGTAAAYAAAFPFVLRLGLSVGPVRLADLVREAWLPAYSLGAALALGLAAVRIGASPDVAVSGLAAYWIAFYALWLRPEERRLVRETLRLRAPPPPGPR